MPMQERPRDRRSIEMEAKTFTSKGVAVFDVCDTLYYSNTTHDFIRYLARNRPGLIRNSRFQLLNHRFSPARFALIGMSVATGSDYFKRANVALLKGAPVSEVQELATRFVGEFLATRKVERTQELVQEYAANGFDVMLCSTSIEPVVDAVAADLGIRDIVATTLEVVDDKYTGRILVDPTGRKLAALRDLSDAEIECAVSDNLSDLELLSAAKRGIAVVHSARKRDFWMGRNLELIELGL